MMWRSWWWCLWCLVLLHCLAVWVGGPVLKYLSRTPFFPIFSLTTVLKFLENSLSWCPTLTVVERRVEATTSLNYYNFVINNPSSKSPPLHILPDAIVVPPQRCFVSTSGRPRQRYRQSSFFCSVLSTELQCASVAKKWPSRDFECDFILAAPLRRPEPMPDYDEDVGGWGCLMAAANQQSNWSSGRGCVTTRWSGTRNN